MKVVISGGGTGGHVYPALAIINKIKDMEPDSSFLYIGTTDRMEKDLVPSLGIPYIGLEIKGLDRKNIFKNISIINMYLKAYNKAKKEIKKFNPDIVIGVGGYVTAPVINAAHSLKIKTIIHEQNSVPGITNKMLAKKVDKIFISMESSRKYFPNDKVIFTGNPRSEEIINAKPISKLEIFNNNKPLVVIVMGSLGSYTINKEELKIVDEFKNKDYNILLITGSKYYDSYKNKNIPSNMKVVPFEKELIRILKSTDLLVSRAGASTIAEITAIGLPSILVPSPYVSENHQYKNAKVLEDNGASIIIPEDEFSSKKILSTIDSLIYDKDKLKSMSIATKKLGVKDSSSRIYKEIKKLVRR